MEKILKEIDGPVVSKAVDDPSYNPFEELSIDEGSAENKKLSLDPEESASGEGNFDESFDESDFGDESGTLVE